MGAFNVPAISLCLIALLSWACGGPVPSESQAPICGRGQAFLSDPTDCTSYYECKGGKAVRVQCPLFLEWNSQANRCDLPWVSLCVVAAVTENPQTAEDVAEILNVVTEGENIGEGTEAPSTEDGGDVTVTESESPEELLCGPGITNLRNPSECTSYYRCIAGKPILTKCILNYEWNSVTNQCDSPSRAACVVSAATTPNPLITEEAEGENIGEGTEAPSTEDGGDVTVTESESPEELLCGPGITNLRNPSECTSYYRCIAGKPILTKCILNYEWNSETNQCDSPSRAACVVSAATTPNPLITEEAEGENIGEGTEAPSTEDGGDVTVTESESPEELLCGPGITNLRNPSECTSYYRCIAGKPILTKCILNYEWNSVTNQCDSPSRAACVVSAATTPNPLITEEAEGENIGEGTEAPSTEDGGGVTVTESESPEELLCGPGITNLRNPSDCTSYYRCIAGKPILTKCILNYEWNSVTNQCDSPSRAACVVSAATTPNPLITEEAEGENIGEGTEAPSTEDGGDVTVTESESPEELLCGPGITNLRNPSDCTSYYRCIAGKPILTKCILNYEWNSVTNQCDSPSRAACVVSAATTPNPLITEEAEGENIGEGTEAPSTEDGGDVTVTESESPEELLCGPGITNLRNPSDCTSYYRCIAGKPILTKCILNYEWNSVTNQCDSPSRAACVVSAATTPNPLITEEAEGENIGEGTEAPSTEDGGDVTVTESESPEELLCGPGITNLRNPSDCTSYYRCIAGKPILTKCILNYEWNSVTNQCDSPSRAACVVSAATTPNPLITEEAEGENIGEGTEAPSTEDGGDVTVTESESPEELLCGPGITNLRNPSDCTSYYRCIAGKPILTKCILNYEWNSETNQCDSPSRAACVVLAATTPNPLITEDAGVVTEGEYIEVATEAPSTEDGGDVTVTESESPEELLCGPGKTYLPNPLDCNSYYQCVNGEPVLRKCLLFLEWNTQSDVCDLPWIAGCVELTAPTANPQVSEVTTEEVEITTESETGGEESETPEELVTTDASVTEDGGEDPVTESESPEVSDVTNEVTEDSVTISENPEEPDITTEAPSTEDVDGSVTESESPEELLCGPGKTYLPNPLDCNSYYQCVNGEPVLRKCLLFLEWNTQSDVCDLPWIAGCVELTAPTANPQVSEVTTEEVEITTESETGGEESETPEELVTTDASVTEDGGEDPVTESESPEVSDVTNEVTEDSVTISENPEEPDITTEAPSTEDVDGSVTESESPEELLCGPDTTYLPNPLDCNSYYQCINGEPILKRCMKYLEWNLVTKVCDLPWRSGCVVVAATTANPQVTIVTTEELEITESEDGGGETATSVETDVTASTEGSSEQSVTESESSEEQDVSSESGVSDDSSATESEAIEEPDVTSESAVTDDSSATASETTEELDVTSESAVTDDSSVTESETTEEPDVTSEAAVTNDSSATESETTEEPVVTSEAAITEDSGDGSVTVNVSPQKPDVTSEAAVTEDGGEGNVSRCPRDANTPRCPTYYSYMPAFIPHSDPHYFYECSNGTPYCQACPANLEWNTRCNTCDWPGQDNCP